MFNRDRVCEFQPIPQRKVINHDELRERQVKRQQVSMAPKKGALNQTKLTSVHRDFNSWRTFPFLGRAAHLYQMEQL